MRPSRGMGAIKKTKLPSAVENTMPKGVKLKIISKYNKNHFKKHSGSDPLR